MAFLRRMSVLDNGLNLAVSTSLTESESLALACKAKEMGVHLTFRGAHFLPYLNKIVEIGYKDITFDC